MLNLTAEEWEILKTVEAGRHLLDNLRKELDRLKNHVCRAGCLNGASMETTALNYATMAGKMDALFEILDYQPKQEDQE